LIGGREDDDAELFFHAAAPDGCYSLVSLATKFMDEDERVVGLSNENLELLAWSVSDQIIEGIADARLSVTS
jgi:hypothetical protein